MSVPSAVGLPLMENAVLTLAQIENSAAVQKAITHYEEEMNQNSDDHRDLSGAAEPAQDL